MHPKDLSISEFSYALPTERIARYPLQQRDDSKLLVYKSDKIIDDHYRNIANYIPPHSLLIFNNTKVVEARLLFQKSTGGIIEIFCLEPHEQYVDMATAMQQTGSVLWKCLVGGASKWKRGQLLEKKIETIKTSIAIQAKFIEKRSDHFIIELSWSPAGFTFAEILHHAGSIPLPPYLNRQAESNDVERYQTVYAESEGSVAAPTAGLHFTQRIFHDLKNKNIDTDFITLHVGAGTFKPVKSATMDDHEMHAEFACITSKIIDELLSHLTGDILAVGTTSLRCLESLYWMGVNLINQKDNYSHITQWEAYENAGNKITAKQALEAIQGWFVQNNTTQLWLRTQIIIAPGYQPRIVNGLITNFHQPQSTLLLLIAALVGTDWRKIYDHALSHDYRFLSYGDGSLLRFKRYSFS